MTADVAAHSADLPKPLQQESMHECPKCTATKASALQHGTQHDPENDGDVDHSRVVRTNNRLKKLTLDLEPLSEVQQRNAALCWDDFDNVQVRASRECCVTANVTPWTQALGELAKSRLKSAQ
jgi:hypothetical protein